MFFITPPELAGVDTMIPPVISFALFIGVALATQKKYPGRPGIVDYVPPEEDVVRGEDLKGYADTAGYRR
jgi:fructose-specific phosphotransferase system IIC component